MKKRAYTLVTYNGIISVVLLFLCFQAFSVYAYSVTPSQKIEAQQKMIGGETHVTIRLHNPSTQIAFFERSTVSQTKDGNEILPIEYTDNYVTVFPCEMVEVEVTIWKDIPVKWVRIEGYNNSGYFSTNKIKTLIKTTLQ